MVSVSDDDSAEFLPSVRHRLPVRNTDTQSPPRTARRCGGRQGQAGGIRGHRVAGGRRRSACPGRLSGGRWVAGVCGAGAGLLAGSAVGPATSRRLPQCSSHHRSASTNDDRNGADEKKPVIVTTTSLKRLKQLRAERAPDTRTAPRRRPRCGHGWRGPSEAGGRRWRDVTAGMVRRACRHGIRNVCSARLVTDC